MSTPLEALLTVVPVPAASAPDWWSRTHSVRLASRSSIERAVLLGAHADRLGYAFLGGYASAVTALDPSLGPDELGALCATESGGGHPRAIHTTLVDGKLTGEKHFVSGGPHATHLLVVAKVGEAHGRPVLSVARIANGAPGLTMAEGRVVDFVPEIPHGSVTFADAVVDAVLEGDGYERYLKPFRTIEDLHVFGAVCACLVANGRDVLPKEQVEALLGVIAAILALGREDPRSSAVHLSLAGVLTAAKGLVDAIEPQRFEAGFGERFVRDLPLLRVAQWAREQRRVKAWESVAPRPGREDGPSLEG